MSTLQIERRIELRIRWVGDTYNTDMPIYCRDSLVGAGFEELGANDLLDSKHNAVLASNADSGAAVLHRFDGIFDLEISTVGGEDGVG